MLTSKWLSNVSLAICLFAAVLLAGNQFGALHALTLPYRINTPALCLLFGFVTACCSMRLAIASCVFALPLLPTFASQFQLYTGYGRIQDVTSSGLDLVVGVLLGLVVNSLLKKQPLRTRLALPWPAGLVMVILTVSVIVAIARNLHQSDSPFALRALLYNLLHLRTLGWHDDYRPLVDWVAYCMAFLLLALFVPALKNMQNRNDVIFKPLIAGLVVAALVGWRQAIFGAGLNLFQLNFRLDQFGFMALGFQPDLHAFGAHMLIGVIGLVGYLYAKTDLRSRVFLLGFVLPLCSFALFLSKSKATFVVAVLGLLILSMLWLFRHTKYFRPVVLNVVLCSLMFILSVVIFADAWLALLSLLVRKFDVPDLYTLNLKLSYRPEVYAAALQMARLFPFAGLGLGEFYHQSANHDLTQSYFLSYEQNGENAHNYFLQTLVENGVLGFAAFAVLLIYPVVRAKNKRALLPGLVALASVFGGNLFSHSMLVRENLLLAACFLALMYAWVAAETRSTTQDKSPSAALDRQSLGLSLHQLGTWITQPKVLTACVLLTVLLIATETYQSFKGRPFNLDSQCTESRQLERGRDGWTTGRQVFDMPVGAQGVVLSLATTQPDVVKRPLPGSLTIWADRRLLLTKDFLLTKTGPQSLEISLPEGVLATPDDYQIELKIQRCFTPRNFGINGDGRKLGIQLESVQWQ